jgi:hypothetical protein
MTPPSDDATLLSHGARELPSVRVDAYNAELTDPSGEGFLGDRASNRAFMEILEDWRERVSRGNGGEDPLEGTLAEARPTHEIDRGELDELLLKAGRTRRRPASCIRRSRTSRRRRSASCAASCACRLGGGRSASRWAAASWARTSG